MQPDWKGVCPDTIGQARLVAGKDYVVLMADMFGTGYGAKPKTQDELRAGMLAVHKDLPFTLACGTAAYDTLIGGAGHWVQQEAPEPVNAALDAFLDSI